MAKETKSIKYLLSSLSELPVHFGKVWVTTTGGTVWANETTDLNSGTASDVPLGGAINDALYIGSANLFGGVTISFGTQSSGGTAVWEYWNGSTWATLTTSGYTATNPVTTFNAAWEAPSDWATTTVNSEVDGPWYYVRLRVTGTRTTGGTASQGSLAPIHVINASTIEIPETTNRTIRHCSVNLYFEKTGANGSILNLMRVSGAWDGGSLAALKTTFATDNSWTTWNEKASLIDYIDITSSAQTAWASGTSHTYSMQVCGMGRTTGVGASTNSDHKVWAEMIITYESEDTNTTKANTVTLAIPSILGTLPTTQTLLGTIPIISGGVLEESGVVIKDLYITFHANWDEAGTTDWLFYGQLNSEGETLLSDNDGVSQSDWYMPIPWRRLDLNPNITNNLNCRVSSNTGATASHICATVTITYTYNDSSSTRLTHTEEIPYTVWQGNGAGTTIGDRAIKPIKFWVPGSSPSFKNFGALSTWNQQADPGNMRITLGNASERVFTSPAADVSGPILAMTVNTSADFTMARGLNTIELKAYVDSAVANVGALTGLAYATWSYTRESGKNHYTGHATLNSQTDFNAISRTVNSNTNFWIPNNSQPYYLTNCGCDIQLTTSSTINTIFPSVIQPLSGGRLEVPAKLLFTDSNMGARGIYNELDDREIKRFLDQYTAPGWKRLNPLDPFTAILDIAASSRISSLLKYNWHNYTWTVSGTVSGSSGGTVTLSLFDSLTHEKLQETTRSGDGAYSFTHFDDTREVYVTARENDTNAKMSKSDVAGSGFDIDFSTGGAGGGPTSYAFIG